MRHRDAPRDDPGDDPRIKHLREIARKGQRALVEQIRTLRAEWKTDDLLAVLNWHLPNMTDPATIETWVQLAQYRPPETIEAVEALSHFGGVPAPPDWIYRVPGAGFVLGPLLFTRKLAIRTAHTIIAEQRRPTFRNAANNLTMLEREFVSRRGAGLDPESRVAFHDVLVVCRAAIDRLAQLPAPWAARLRRCPRPECRRYFWNKSTRPDYGTYCTEACEKALKRR